MYIEKLSRGYRGGKTVFKACKPLHVKRVDLKRIV